MKTYNRSLDRLAMAVVAFKRGNPQKAAAVFAAACNEKDSMRAIAIIEASNAEAHSNKQRARVSASKRRLRAYDELGEDFEEVGAEFEDDGMDDDAELDADLEDLEDSEDLEEDEGEAEMARVMSKMFRRSGRR